MSDVVEVNECAILATTMGAEWWLLFQARQVGRIDIVTPSIAGNRVHVRCDDRAHAEWLTTTMIAAGIPKSAVKPRRIRRPGEEGNIP